MYEQIFDRVRREAELLHSVKIRKTTSYLGHILRNDKYHLPKLIIKGKIEGSADLEERGYPSSKTYAGRQVLRLRNSLEPQNLPQ